MTPAAPEVSVPAVSSGSRSSVFLACFGRRISERCWLSAQPCPVATASIHAQDAIPAPLAHISENFAAAVTAKDAAKVASFYTDDAVLLPPNSQMIKGRAAIQNFFQGMMQQNPTLKLTPVAASIAGSQAYEMGTSLVTMRPAAPSAPAASAAGPGMTSPGKYIVVYKKVGNDWKIAYDIFNDNQPAAPPPPGARGR